MWRIELVTAAGVDLLGWWADRETAAAIARHYRREAKGDPGFICVRVRLERKMQPAGGRRRWH